MFIDARTVGGARSFSADVCIVGAGPAGIALALDLGRVSGLRILLIESGGLEWDDAAAALNQGSCSGDPYGDVSAIRARGFAGTATIWNTSAPGSTGTKYLPLDPIDFEKRPWVPHSGWPFDYQHLVPWYEKAQEFCRLGPFQYSAEDWSAGDVQPWPLRSSDVQSAVYQLGPDLRFTRDARSEVRALENVHCLLNATVVAINTTLPVARGGGGQKVAGLRARTLSGLSLNLTATFYVLAAGAIENARVLLASGIGNEHDQVGRYYMDHPTQVFAEFVPADQSLFKRSAFYDRRVFRGTEVLGRLVLSRAAMERERILNLGIYLFPRPARHRWLSVEAVQKLKVLIRDRSFTPEFFGHSFRATVGLPWIVAYAWRRAQGQRFATQGWSRWPDNSGAYRAFHPIFNLEQSPDPGNRVTLGPGRDALGMLQPAVHWRWRDLDRCSVSSAARIIDAAFRTAGLGRWELLTTSEFGPSNHHSAGTTRMSDDARHGVVDAMGKVHGIDNLFVSGASIFPTCGYQNPMLTIIAMSLRLADHLARSVSQAVPSR